MYFVHLLIFINLVLLYKAAIGTKGGFILKHSVGHMPQHTEIDAPLTYADYCFIEAMKRYRELFAG